MATTIKELRAKRDKLLAHAREIHDTATHAENQAAGDAVAAVQKEIGEHIAEGAMPCPMCAEVDADGKEIPGAMPIGMEQPAGRGRIEYEVGCGSCKPFKHTDGTIRRVGVRGGLLPKHAVDAWNAGPDEWTIVPEVTASPIATAVDDEAPASTSS